MPWQTDNKVVTATEDTLVPPNEDRLVLDIFNNSAGTIYIYPNQEQGTADGFPIPTGTGKTLRIVDGFDVTGEFRVIGSGAGLDVRVMESFAPLRSRHKKVG